MRDRGRAVCTRVGRMVQQLRLQRGWRQEQLAERANSSTKHVGSIERGDVNVGLAVLAELARGLSVNLSDLVREPGRRQGTRSTLHVISSDDVAHLEKVAAIVRRIKSARPRAPRSSSG